MRFAGLCVLLSFLELGGCATPDKGVRVRVAFDENRIISARASGLADRRSGRAVTADDQVRVASVSKLVVALGVMRLVEAQQLELDRDVSDYLGWQLRHPAYPDDRITLRLLLSHRASLIDNVDYALPLGGHLQDTLHDPQAWETKRPGTWFRYANLNFPVVASVMERATGERFDQLMARLVFRPLQLDACFNWTTCSDVAIAHAVVLYGDDGSIRRDDLQGRRPACPVLVTSGPCDLSTYRPGDNGALFSPQGGLRISARGLARIGQMFLRGGEGFLLRSSLLTVLDPAFTYDGKNGETENGFFCTYGLALQSLPNRTKGCRDNLFNDKALRSGHAGEAYGLRSGLWMAPLKGRGVAFFATAIPDSATGKGRHSAFTRVEEELAKGD